MRKKLWLAVALAVLITIALSATCELFDTRLAELTIDWFSFLAGGFLVIEGLYKIFSSEKPLLRDQVFRTFRVIIGTTVFTIHLLQFMRY